MGLLIYQPSWCPRDTSNTCDILIRSWKSHFTQVQKQANKSRGITTVKYAALFAELPHSPSLCEGRLINVVYDHPLAESPQTFETSPTSSSYAIDLPIECFEKTCWHTSFSWTRFAVIWQLTVLLAGFVYFSTRFLLQSKVLNHQPRSMCSLTTMAPN